MYQIIVHAKPKKDSEQYGKVLGAYVTTFIDFKEINAAYLLAKHYIEEQGWEVIALEEEYFVIDSIDDMTESYNQYFNEIIEYGYTLIFNTYDSIEEEEVVEEEVSE